MAHQPLSVSSRAGGFQQTSESRQFIDYWKSIRRPGEGLIPLRADLNPAAIKHLLPFVFIVEIGERDARFRLVGTAMTDRARRELTGMYYSQLTSPEQVRNSLARVRIAFSHPCGLYWYFEEDYGFGVSTIVELTMLPLRTSEDAFGQTVSLAMPINYDRNAPDEDFHRYKLAANEQFSVIDIGAGLPDHIP